MTAVIIEDQALKGLEGNVVIVTGKLIPQPHRHRLICGVHRWFIRYRPSHRLTCTGTRSKSCHGRSQLPAT